MESKTKHRILGIIVMAGLGIILLPFLHSGKDSSAELTSLKAPAFPDQSAQVNNNNPTVASNPAGPAPAPVTEPQASNEPQSLPIIQKTANEIVNQQPDEAINTSHISPQMDAPVISNPSANSKSAVETVTENSTAIAAAPAITTTETTKTETTKTAENAVLPTETTINDTTSQQLTKLTANEERPKTLTHKNIHTAKASAKKALLASASRKLAKRSSYVHLPIDNNGLANIHHSVWVIQVGSYRNKKHALREVNRLRASGYRAFIQQVATTLGSNTQVFVGPESKQTHARALAKELEHDMHVKGMVISYKPLAS